MCHDEEEEKDMQSTSEKKHKNTPKLNIHSDKFKQKVPHLSIVNGKAQIDPNSLKPSKMV